MGTITTNNKQKEKMKHIPTLSIVFFKETDLYGYEYDDINGLTQTEYGYVSVDAALGDAFKRLKTFTVLEDVETK
jgi:hypothetical protein